MKKKFLLILLALATALTMASCSQGAYMGDDEDDDDEKEVEQKPSKDDDDNDDEEYDGLHKHQYTVVINQDADSHELKCAECEKTKTEEHTYAQGTCSACQKECPFAYELYPDEGVCKITYYREDRAQVKVPSTIEGCKVTTICDEVFCGLTNCTEIVLPESINEIYSRAFVNCSALKKINIPAALNVVGSIPFVNCDSLETVNYGGTVKQWSAFYFETDYIDFQTVQCSDGEYSYVFDYTVNDDGSSCTIYDINYEMEKVVLPAILNGYRVTHIGDGDYSLYEVWGENPIREVVLPDSVVAINACAFKSFSNMTKVNIPDSVTFIGDSAFYSCGITEITIPASVSSMGESVFYYCESLEKAAFKGTMAEWNTMELALDNIFGYTLVESLQCSDGDLVWGFAYEVNEDGETCTITEILLYKTHLVLPAMIDGYRVTRIGNGSNSLYSGWFTPSIESVVIPEGVLEISDKAFNKFGYMTEVQLPSTLVRIGSDAFRNCGLLAVVIPDSVTEIGYAAFEYCDLESVTLPAGITVIGEAIFKNCENLTQIVIPDTVTEIASSAFKYCRGLEKVVLPSSVTKISDSAFEYCSSLKEIVLPDSITRIEQHTFRGCTNLEKITLSGSLNYIGVNSLRECENLTTIEFKGTVAEWNAVQFDSYWDLGTGDYTVYCSDGTIS